MKRRGQVWELTESSRARRRIPWVKKGRKRFRAEIKGRGRGALKTRNLRNFPEEASNPGFYRFSVRLFECTTPIVALQGWIQMCQSPESKMSSFPPFSRSEQGSPRVSLDRTVQKRKRLVAGEGERGKGRGRGGKVEDQVRRRRRRRMERKKWEWNRRAEIG